MKKHKLTSAFGLSFHLPVIGFLIASLILPQAILPVPLTAGARSEAQETAGQQSSIESLIQIAQELYSQQKYDLAIPSYRLLINEIDKAPDAKSYEETKAQSFLVIADCYIKLGDKENAKQAFYEFFKLRPNLEEDPLLPEGLAVIYGEAKAEYRLMIAAKPAQPAAPEAETAKDVPAQEAAPKEVVEEAAERPKAEPEKAGEEKPATEAPAKPKEEPKTPPQPQAPQQKPVVKAKPGEAGTGKKKGSSALFIIGGLAVGGVAALLLLGGKGTPEDGGPAAPTTGSIQVNSTPSGAGVELDGSYYGTTPLTISSASVGNHSIRLTKENYRDYSGTVSVSGGQTTTVNPTLSKNTISVTRPAPGESYKIGSMVSIMWGTDTAVATGYDFGNIPIGLSNRAPGRIGLVARAGGGAAISSLPGGGQRASQRRGGELEVPAAAGAGVGAGARRNVIIPGREARAALSLRMAAAVRAGRPQSGTGGRTATAGESPEVRALSVSNVSIDLYKGGSRLRTIQSSTVNDGRHDWTISTSLGLSTGSDYRIRVSSTTDSSLYGVSGVFSISKDTGSIKVTSTPTGARVYLDGEDQYETTTCTLSGVSTGSHTVRVEKDGYNSAEKTVSVSANRTTDVSFTLGKKTPGSLKITSTPTGARVYLDGQDRGQTTPCTLSNIAEGYHTLKLVRKFYGKWEGEVYVNAGSPATEVHKNLDAFKYDFVMAWKGAYPLKEPMGLSVDNGNRIYVADMSNNRIQKFDANGGFIRKWSVSGNPRWVAVSPSGLVYVADTENNRIKRYDTNGNFQKDWGGKGSSPGKFNAPWAVGVDDVGFVYVSDKGNQRVQKFDKNGVWKKQWGGYGAAFGDLWGIAGYRSNYVYVADSSNRRILKYTTEGSYRLQWDGSDSTDGIFDYPCGVAVDSEGYVYVVDIDSKRVVKFDANGNFLTQIGGSGNYQFSRPEGVGVDSEGNVYVTDRDWGQIRKFGISSRTEQQANGPARTVPLVNPLRSAPRLDPDRRNLMDRLNAIRESGRRNEVEKGRNDK